MNLSLLLLVAGIIQLSGACASIQPQTDPLTNPSHSRLTPTTQAEESMDRIELTEDVLYKLLVAEIAGQRGHLELAINNYLELARTIPDPQLAERATHIAIFAKQDDKALEAARLWVKRRPSNLEARQVLAAMLIRNGHIDEALPHLEFVLSAEEGNVGQKLRMIATFLSREQDKEAALKVMEKLVTRHGNDPDALLAYAFLALRADQIDKARQAMEKVIKLVPPNLTIAMTYLSVLQKAGDMPAALNWIEGVVTQHPEEFDLRMLYARLLAEVKRFDKAREQFEILAKVAPDNADVHYGLGLLYLQANRLEAAKQHFTALLDSEQYENEAHYYLGQITEADKDYEAALKWYSAIDGDNLYFDAQLNIALVLAKQGKYEEARDQLHAIHAETPQQQLRILRVEGEILTQQGRYTEAMALYDRALGDRYDSELLYTRAMLAEKMGRLDILERDLRRILEREPDNAQTLNALGYTLADRTNRYQEAYTLIKRALELSPNDFYILDSMGWVLYRLGRLQEAVEYLRRAKEIRNDPEVAAHLGEVLWVMGDKEEARIVWESGLQATPGDKHLLEVIKRFKP